MSNNPFQGAIRSASISLPTGSHPIVRRGKLHETFIGARAMTTGNFASAGALVADEIIDTLDTLRNQSVCLVAGANLITGLKGDSRLVYSKTDPAVHWIAEGEEVDDEDPDLAVILMVPHQVSCKISYSTTWLAGAGTRGEKYMEDLLGRALARALDGAALAGTGGVQPLGILNTPGANTVTFGGAPTWGKVLDMEHEVDEDNAPLGARAYIGSPSVKRIWKETERVEGNGRFLWDGNQVNGERGLATKNIVDHRAIFGAWNELFLGLWDVVLLRDPLTSADNGIVHLYMHIYADVGFRPQSFCVSTDSAAQEGA